MYKLICNNISKSKGSLTSFTNPYKKVAQNYESHSRSPEPRTRDFLSESNISYRETSPKENDELTATESDPDMKTVSYNSFFTKEMRAASLTCPILEVKKSSNSIRTLSYSSNPSKYLYSSMVDHSKVKKKTFKNREAVEMYRNALDQCNKIKNNRFKMGSIYRSSSWFPRPIRPGYSWEEMEDKDEMESEEIVVEEKPEEPPEPHVPKMKKVVHVFQDRRQIGPINKEIENISQKKPHHQFKSRKVRITYPTHTVNYRIGMNKPYYLDQLVANQSNKSTYEDITKVRNNAKGVNTADALQVKYKSQPNLALLMKLKSPMEAPASKVEETTEDKVENVENVDESMMKQHPTVEKGVRVARMAMSNKYSQLLSKIFTKNQDESARHHETIVEDETSRDNSVEELAKPVEKETEDQENATVMKHPMGVHKTQEQVEVPLRYTRRLIFEKPESYDIEATCMKHKGAPATPSKYGDYVVEIDRKAQYHKSKEEEAQLEKYEEQLNKEKENEELKESTNKTEKPQTPAESLAQYLKKLKELKEQTAVDRTSITPPRPTESSIKDVGQRVKIIGETIKTDTAKKIEEKRSKLNDVKDDETVREEAKVSAKPAEKKIEIKTPVAPKIRTVTRKPKQKIDDIPDYEKRNRENMKELIRKQMGVKKLKTITYPSEDTIKKSRINLTLPKNINRTIQPETINLKEAMKSSLDNTRSAESSQDVKNATKIVQPQPIAVRQLEASCADDTKSTERLQSGKNAKGIVEYQTLQETETEEYTVEEIKRAENLQNLLEHYIVTGEEVKDKNENIDSVNESEADIYNLANIQIPPLPDLDSLPKTEKKDRKEKKKEKDGPRKKHKYELSEATLENAVKNEILLNAKQDELNKTPVNLYSQVENTVTVEDIENVLKSCRINESPRVKEENVKKTETAGKNMAQKDKSSAIDPMSSRVLRNKTYETNKEKAKDKQEMLQAKKDNVKVLKKAKTLNDIFKNHDYEDTIPHKILIITELKETILDKPPQAMKTIKTKEICLPQPRSKSEQPRATKELKDKSHKRQPVDDKVAIKTKEGQLSEKKQQQSKSEQPSVDKMSLKDKVSLENLEIQKQNRKGKLVDEEELMKKIKYPSMAIQKSMQRDAYNKLKEAGQQLVQPSNELSNKALMSRSRSMPEDEKKPAMRLDGKSQNKSTPGANASKPDSQNEAKKDTTSAKEEVDDKPAAKQREKSMELVSKKKEDTKSTSEKEKRTTSLDNRPIIRQERPEPPPKDRSKKERPKSKKDMILPPKVHSKEGKIPSPIDLIAEDLIKATKMIDTLALEYTTKCQSLAELFEQQKKEMLEEINNKLKAKSDSDLLKQKPATCGAAKTSTDTGRIEKQTKPEKKEEKPNLKASESKEVVAVSKEKGNKSNTTAVVAQQTKSKELMKVTDSLIKYEEGKEPITLENVSNQTPPADKDNKELAKRIENQKRDKKIVKQLNKSGKSLIPVKIAVKIPETKKTEARKDSMVKDTQKPDVIVASASKSVESMKVEAQKPKVDTIKEEVKKVPVVHTTKPSSVMPIKEESSKVDTRKDLTAKNTQKPPAVIVIKSADARRSASKSVEPKKEVQKPKIVAVKEEIKKIPVVQAVKPPSKVDKDIKNKGNALSKQDTKKVVVVNLKPLPGFMENVSKLDSKKPVQKQSKEEAKKDKEAKEKVSIVLTKPQVIDTAARKETKTEEKVIKKDDGKILGVINLTPQSSLMDNVARVEVDEFEEEEGQKREEEEEEYEYDAILNPDIERSAINMMYAIQKNVEKGSGTTKKVPENVDIQKDNREHRSVLDYIYDRNDPSKPGYKKRSIIGEIYENHYPRKMKGKGKKKRMMLSKSLSQPVLSEIHQYKPLEETNENSSRMARKRSSILNEIHTEDEAEGMERNERTNDMRNEQSLLNQIHSEDYKFDFTNKEEIEKDESERHEIKRWVNNDMYLTNSLEEEDDFSINEPIEKAAPPKTTLKVEQVSSSDKLKLTSKDTDTASVNSDLYKLKERKTGLETSKAVNVETKDESTSFVKNKEVDTKKGEDKKRNIIDKGRIKPKPPKLEARKDSYEESNVSKPVAKINMDRVSREIADITEQLLNNIDISVSAQDTQHKKPVTEDTKLAATRDKPKPETPKRDQSDTKIAKTVDKKTAPIRHRPEGSFYKKTLDPEPKSSGKKSSQMSPRTSKKEEPKKASPQSKPTTQAVTKTETVDKKDYKLSSSGQKLTEQKWTKPIVKTSAIIKLDRPPPTAIAVTKPEIVMPIRSIPIPTSLMQKKIDIKLDVPNIQKNIEIKKVSEVLEKEDIKEVPLLKAVEQPKALNITGITTQIEKKVQDESEVDRKKTVNITNRLINEENTTKSFLLEPIEDKTKNVEISSLVGGKTPESKLFIPEPIQKQIESVKDSRYLLENFNKQAILQSKSIESKSGEQTSGRSMTSPSNRQKDIKITVKVAPEKSKTSTKKSKEGKEVAENVSEDITDCLVLQPLGNNAAKDAGTSHPTELKVDIRPTTPEELTKDAQTSTHPKGIQTTTKPKNVESTKPTTDVLKTVEKKVVQISSKVLEPIPQNNRLEARQSLQELRKQKTDKKQHEDNIAKAGKPNIVIIELTRDPMILSLLTKTHNLTSKDSPKVLASRSDTSVSKVKSTSQMEKSKKLETPSTMPDLGPIKTRVASLVKKSFDYLSKTLENSLNKEAPQKTEPTNQIDEAFWCNGKIYGNDPISALSESKYHTDIKDLLPNATKTHEKHKVKQQDCTDLGIEEAFWCNGKLYGTDTIYTPNDSKDASMDKNRSLSNLTRRQDCECFINSETEIEEAFWCNGKIYAADSASTLSKDKYTPVKTESVTKTDDKRPRAMDYSVGDGIDEAFWCNGKIYGTDCPFPPSKGKCASTEKKRSLPNVIKKHDSQIFKEQDYSTSSASGIEESFWCNGKIYATDSASALREHKYDYELESLLDNVGKYEDKKSRNAPHGKLCDLLYTVPLMSDIQVDDIEVRESKSESYKFLKNKNMYEESLLSNQLDKEFSKYLVYKGYTDALECKELQSSQSVRIDISRKSDVLDDYLFKPIKHMTEEEITDCFYYYLGEDLLQTEFSKNLIYKSLDRKSEDIVTDETKIVLDKNLLKEPIQSDLSETEHFEKEVDVREEDKKEVNNILKAKKKQSQPTYSLKLVNRRQKVENEESEDTEQDAGKTTKLLNIGAKYTAEMQEKRTKEMYTRRDRIQAAMTKQVPNIKPGIRNCSIFIEKTPANRYATEKVVEKPPQPVVGFCERLCIPPRTLSEIALKQNIQDATTLNRGVENRISGVSMPNRSTNRSRKIKIMHMILRTPGKRSDEHFLPAVLKSAQISEQKSEKSKERVRLTRAELVELRYKLLQRLHQEFNSLSESKKNKGNFDRVAKHYEQMVKAERKRSESQKEDIDLQKEICDVTFTIPSHVNNSTEIFIRKLQQQELRDRKLREQMEKDNEVPKNKGDDDKK